MRLLEHAGVTLPSTRRSHRPLEHVGSRSRCSCSNAMHVTICHSKSRDLENIARSAIYWLPAVGRASRHGRMVSRALRDRRRRESPDWRFLAGDVEFASAAEVAGWITPVPACRTDDHCHAS